MARFPRIFYYQHKIRVAWDEFEILNCNMILKSDMDPRLPRIIYNQVDTRLSYGSNQCYRDASFARTLQQQLLENAFSKPDYN